MSKWLLYLYSSKGIIPLLKSYSWTDWIEQYKKIDSQYDVALYCMYVHNVVFTICQIYAFNVWNLFVTCIVCTKKAYCMFCLTALLEYIQDFYYIDLFVVDVLAWFMYCTSNQDPQSLVELKPHLSYLWSCTLKLY